MSAGGRAAAPGPGAPGLVQLTLPEALARAVEAQRTGRLGEAAAFCRALLQAEPANTRFLLLASIVESGRREFALANELVNRALGVDPRSFEALAHRGTVLESLRRPEEALLSYEAALSVRATPDLLYNHGRVLQSLGRHADAMASYDRALAARADDAEALSNRAVCLLETGRPAEALDSLDRALAVKPDFAEALNNRGNALQALDRHAEALASYGKSLALRPDHADTLNNRGNALRALGRYDEALASFDRALAVRPGYADALINRSGALLALGRHAEALASCDSALALRPESVEALYNRGKVLFALKREEEGLQSYDRGLALRPGNGLLLDARGRVLEAMGRHDEALGSYNAALRAVPGNAEARWHRDLAERRLALPTEVHQALAAWKEGRPEEAERLCREALAADAAQIDALLLLAAISHEREALDEALDLVRRALAARADCHEALVHQATLLLALRRPDEALATSEQALAGRPQSSSALHVRGRALYALKRHVEALESFDRALAVQPHFAEALNSRGNALQALERGREALESYRQALAVRPDYAEALGNRDAAGRRLALDGGDGVDGGLTLSSGRAESAEAYCTRAHALDSLDRLDEALESYERALALRPRHVEALNNYGNLLCKLGRIQDALAAYERVLELRPGDAEAHLNMAFARLLTGDYARGWQEYEWRWEALRAKPPAEVAEKPLWLGQDVGGKTVLVYPEQGFGDFIQMIRYVPLLAARGARVALACPPSMRELAGSLEGAHELFIAGEQPVPFDYHVPVMSLPRAFGTVLEEIPARMPYLRSAPNEADAWRARMAGMKGRLKVGLVWAGNPKHPRDRARSMPVSLLEGLIAVPGCAFFSLQQGEAGKPLAALDPRGEIVVDAGADLRNFADTAALIDALDLVIAVDTSVAHLAGALGKPVWILLPYAPDWRWMRDREDSLWYPSARLFRQPSPGAWSAVMDAVIAQLEGAVGRFCPA